MNPKKESSGSQFYIVWGKKLTDAQIDSMEEQRTSIIERQIFNKLAEERKAEIMEHRRNQDQLSLMILQDEILKQAQDEASKAGKFKYAPEAREAYKNEGGTPHLDGEYTVFGEVTAGLDVIEKIQSAQTGQADRPVQDIKIIGIKILK